MTRRLARDPARRCWPLREWPAHDRILWEDALCPGDPIDPGGPYAAAAPASIRKMTSGHGRFLAWLDQSGELDAAQAPGGRITPERVRAYVRALSAHNGTSTVINRLQELYQVAQVMDPARDWSWIRQHAGRIRARHVPARPKAPRLVGSEELLELGLTLMAEADALDTARQRAIRYRDGLLIALLAARPLRRRNLTGLRVGHSLRQQGADWWIDTPGTETKTGAPIAMPLPAVLSRAVDHYLAVHRPVLAALRGRWWREADDALWLSAHGSPLTEIAFYDRIIQLTRERLGRPINPHLFRDCAATTLAVLDPDHVRIAAPLLGHRTLATTERHYNQARSRQAAARWQEHLIAMRRQPAPDDTEEVGVLNTLIIDVEN